MDTTHMSKSCTTCGAEDPTGACCPCPTCEASPGYHAGLHVGHIWTNVQCPAYRTLRGSDCRCTLANYPKTYNPTASR